MINGLLEEQVCRSRRTKCVGFLLFVHSWLFVPPQSFRRVPQLPDKIHDSLPATDEARLDVEGFFRAQETHLDLYSSSLEG
jgi:hypothetical protein